LVCRLLPHQIEGLTFLMQREAKAAGGLLADDMGLGKTVQTMALLLSNRKQDEACIPSTLVVAPLSLMEQWANEIRSKTNMSVYVHHGPTRKEPRQFANYNVVLTTYQLLVSEHATPNPDLEIDNDRGIFGVTWYRIVLDEAHTIKNRQAKMSQAAYKLRAIKRWCLTGTPIQNTAEDLFSLLKFLQIPPLNDYPTFKEKVSAPVARGKTKLAMQRLGVVLSQIMLRRTKAVLKDGFALPPRTVQHIQVDFSPAERHFYNGLENRAEAALKRMQSSGEAIGYMSVLVLLQRLRQACNHAQLVTKELDVSEYRVAAKSEPDNAVDALANLFSGVGMSSRQCAICLATCSGEHCDACAAAIQGHLSLSCKLAKLMQLLAMHKGKAILFSQWTSMLDLCAPFLEANGIGYVKYYGSMPNKKREASLATLKADPTCRVLLCSLKAGALGLNLTVANLVFMLDVWWNPAIEEQAIDRVHRIGQQQEVKVFKLTVRDTVEDRIIALQDKKREMAKSALGEGGKMSRLGMDELLALF
ncbi:SNF2 family N-terminal domain-domain-containing protein, partial [Protomyces lactucae-debilis]